MNRRQILFIGCLLTSLLNFAQNDIFNIARSGSVADVQTLMKIDSDTINAVNDKGFTALTLACYHENEAVALYLLNHVNNVNGVSKYGTPLMAAVFKEQVLLTKALLEKGANPNIADVNKTTPLHYAVLLKNKTLIELLLDANVDRTLRDSRDKTALDYALMDDNKAIIELLKK